MDAWFKRVEEAKKDTMTPQYKLGERIRFTVDRQETGFDKACDTAYKTALRRFGVDENGHITNVINAGRSDHAIFVEFLAYDMSGGMGGQTHSYEFSAYVSSCGLPRPGTV